MPLSPMMQQYQRIHEQYPDCLLLFRLGDFYEMFFEDAKTASRELELTLTGKECGLEERAPMCGVPYHAVNSYVEKLIARGYRVAICDQMEDPALAKGLVEREVTRVVTAGTVSDPDMLEDRKNNYILCVYAQQDRAGFAWADVSTGEFFVSEPDAASAAAETERIMPSEILCSNTTALRALVPDLRLNANEQNAGWFQEKNAAEVLCAQFHAAHPSALGLDEHRHALCAAGALVRYLRETQKNALEHLRSPRFADGRKTMLLDAGTRRNLELTSSLSGGGKSGSLLGLLDKTCTAMGGRLLRRWIDQPLLDPDEIRARLDAVTDLTADHLRIAALREALKGVYDLERLLSKVSYRSLNARDCLALGASLAKVPEIIQTLETVNADSLRAIRGELDPLEDMTELIGRAIDPDAPALITEGGIIRGGYSKELDEYRSAQTNGKQWLLELEAREREATGIKNLKIQYNRVFGYLIDVTKSFLSQVPDRYTRRQTLANAERFTTEELREIERKIMGAQEQSVRLELQLFGDIREEVAKNVQRIQRTTDALKTLDAFCSLAEAAEEYGYVRPELTDDGSLLIREGRHPVVEHALPAKTFVANDTEMDLGENRMMIITGPNMAGKSTYMRQVALICLMAQTGSFVPAAEARVPVSDRIFTRIGASDDLASGRSTFMVEMSETANILRNATRNSLILLDEIGRGTSTFDGLAIAWAVAEYICDKEKIGAKTLFATHYHELSELEGHLEGVKNYCITVKEHGEDVVFLRRIERGGADKSFGVHVARLAGVPHPVIARAGEIQARLEVSDINQNKIGQNILGENDKPKKNEQVDMFEFRKTEILEELRALDVMALTPMDAINKLFLLREKARKI